MVLFGPRGPSLVSEMASELPEWDTSADGGEARRGRCGRRASVEFRLLGTLDAVRDGESISLGGPKPRSLLAMLLLEANRPVSIDRLITGLWGDDLPAR